MFHVPVTRETNVGGETGTSMHECHSRKGRVAAAGRGEKVICQQLFSAKFEDIQKRTKGTRRKRAHQVDAAGRGAGDALVLIIKSSTYF